MPWPWFRAIAKKSENLQKFKVLRMGLPIVEILVGSVVTFLAYLEFPSSMLIKNKKKSNYANIPRFPRYPPVAKCAAPGELYLDPCYPIFLCNCVRTAALLLQLLRQAITNFDLHCIGGIQTAATMTMSHCLVILA